MTDLQESGVVGSGEGTQSEIRRGCRGLPVGNDPWPSLTRETTSTVSRIGKRSVVPFTCEKTHC